MLGTYRKLVASSSGHQNDIRSIACHIKIGHMAEDAHDFLCFCGEAHKSSVDFRLTNNLLTSRYMMEKVENVVKSATGSDSQFESGIFSLA